MLSDLQKDKLELLANDEVLLTALYKLFFEVAEANRPDVNNVDNNTLLGEKFRSWELSKQIINAGFTTLQAYKKMEKVSEKQLSRAR